MKEWGSERWRGPLLLLPAFVVLTLLFGGGLAAGVAQSLGYFPAAGLTTWTGEHYVDVLTDTGFLQSFWVTFQIALWSTVLSACLAVGLAFLLRAAFRGKGTTIFVVQSPLPIPHLVAAAGILLLVGQSGLLARSAYWLNLIERPGEFPALVYDRAGVAILLTFLWKETPFIFLVVFALLQGIGPQYEEIARTLGASRWQRFRYVLLPLLLPGVLSSSAIVFAFVFANYEIPLLLGARYPPTLPVWAYQRYQDPDLAQRPEALAVGVIIAVVAVMMLVVYRRLVRMMGL